MKRGLSAAILFAFFFFLFPFLPTSAARVSAPLSAPILIALANKDRAQNSAGALAEDPLLARAAQKKADDMAAKGYFSHKSPAGKTPWYWFSAVGYYYLSAGENVALNFDDAEALQRAWMNSPSHRANIIKNKYTRIGVGIARGYYQGRLATFIVEFFATPAPRAARPAGAWAS